MANEKMRKVDRKAFDSTDRSVSILKIFLFYQCLPSLLCFYFLWPKMYTWQLSGSLSKVEPEVIQVLEQKERRYKEMVPVLEEKTVLQYAEQVCYALQCTIVDNRTSSIIGDPSDMLHKEQSLYLTISTDIYDIPIVLEAMNRVERTLELQSLEVHQYDRLAKIIVRYKFYNPSIVQYEWLGNLSLSANQRDLLEQASVVHLWNRFVEEEATRKQLEGQHIMAIRPDLAVNLINLRKSKGVLMYRKNKGFTFMPLQQN